MNWANALIPTLSRPKPRGTWPALREWEDIRLLIPKVSLHKLKQYKTLSINIISNNTNLFNNKSHSSYYISHKSQNQTQVMHLIQPIFINPPKYIKHVKHVNTHDTITTAVSKIMQVHISLHSIAGEEWDRRNVGEVTFNSRDPEKNSWGELELTE